MKTRLMGCVLILLVLVGVTASARLPTSPAGQIEMKDKQCIREGGDSIRGLYYGPEGIAWSEQIRASSRKRRPYRNPSRRYRLSKKQKRCLRRRLRCMAEIADELTGSGKKVSSASPRATVLLIGDSSPSARWS